MLSALDVATIKGGRDRVVSLSLCRNSCPGVLQLFVFILATTEVQKIPATILSRCQRFDFRRVPQPLIEDHLTRLIGLEQIKAEAAAIRLIARKADGRLANPTKAASTIDIPANRRPNQEKNAVTKFTDDEESWTTYAKQEAVEATGRMQCSTAAGKTVEIPVVRLASFDDTSSRLPFEFRGVNQSETVPVGFNLGATVDIVNKSSGSAHGAISFNTDGTEPAIKGRTPNYVGPMGKHNFPMSQGQKFLHQVRKDNIEAGPNIG